MVEKRKIPKSNRNLSLWNWMLGKPGNGATKRESEGHMCGRSSKMRSLLCFIRRDEYSWSTVQTFVFVAKRKTG